MKSIFAKYREKYKKNLTRKSKYDIIPLNGHDASGRPPKMRGAWIEKKHTDPKQCKGVLRQQHPPAV